MSIALALAPAGLALGQAPDMPRGESFLQKPAARRSDDDRLYQKGKAAIDARRWDDALRDFSEAASQNGQNADGALYWKAYALNKLGRRQESLATIAELRKSYSGSRWLDDAKELELEVQQASGHAPNPSSEPDEELKIMALNGLMNSDPERALPMLEKFLQGNQSPKLKEKALFVLAQSDSAKGRQILSQIARGGSNPDLQMKAINYLGIMGSHENRQVLSDVYAASNDPNVKRAVLHAFMVSGDRAHLLTAAKSEKNADLRMDAIHQLGISGGQSELWQLYQAEPSIDVKEKILHSMFIGGNSANLIDVARHEKEIRLRKAAIHSLGLMGEETGGTLASMYSSEADPSLRSEIINALFIQGNAKAMVELARKETNPEMRKMIVSKLSVMGNRDATEYLMEILNK
ncbi:MAG TPA: HEAT repeat domain-containing protein [Bryobacteraceae bacterium]|nr:HEAT repeat domain-containing protein [Bryobacteraceae bacterium]